MSKYLFYPGCSLQRNARAYLDSTEAIREDINIVLEEVQDWNCCGATEYKSVYRVPWWAGIWPWHRNKSMERIRWWQAAALVI